MPGRIIGLDIGHYSVKVVVLSVSFRHWEVIEAAEELIEPGVDPSVPRSEDGLEATTAPPPEGSERDRLDFLSAGALAAIGRLGQRGLLEGDAIITALPRDAAYLTHVSLPFDNPAQIAEVLPLQLDGRLPEDVEDLLLDFMVGGRVSESNQVFAAAVSPAHIATIIATLSQVGAEPRIVDLSPFPLLTAACSNTDTADEVAAYVDLGWRETGVVVARKSTIRYVRVFAGGGELITDALAETFGLEPAVARLGKHREGFIDAGQPESSATTGNDAADTANACRNAVKPLIKRLRTTLQATLGETGDVVNVLYLSGATAQLPGLAEYIAQSLGVRTEVLLPNAPGVATNAEFANNQARYASALGLALRGVPGTTGSRFNFRKGPFAFSGNYEFLRARAGALGVAAAAIVAASLIFGFGRFAQLRAERKALDAALATVTAEIFGEAIAEPRSIRTRLASATGGPVLHPSRSAFDVFVNAANVVGDMQDQQREVTARTVDVDFSRFIFRIDGEAANAETVDQLQRDLDSLECLGTIVRNDLSQAPGGSGFRYALQAPIDCGNPASGVAASSGAAGSTRGSGVGGRR